MRTQRLFLHGVAKVYSMHRRFYPQTICSLSHNYLIIIFYLSYNGRQRAILGMVRGAAPKEPKFRGRSYAIHLGDPMRSRESQRVAQKYSMYWPFP